MIQEKLSVIFVDNVSQIVPLILTVLYKNLLFLYIYTKQKSKITVTYLFVYNI